MMAVSTKLFGVTLLMAMLLGISACGDENKSSSDELVPEGPTFLANIELAGILSDTDIESLFDVLPAGDDGFPGLDDLMDQVLEETGIDLRQVSNVRVFGNLFGEDEDQYFGLIVRGTFDEGALAKALEEGTDDVVNTSQYKDHEVYTDHGESQLALSLVEEDLLVYGSLDAVRAVIDVREGDAKPGSGKVFDILDEVDEALIQVAVEVPAGAVEDFEDIPFNLSSLADITAVAASFDKDGESLRTHAVVDFLSAESALAARDSIEGFRLIARGQITDEGAKELLDKLEVEAEGERLVVDYEATVSELQELAESLESLGDQLRGLFGDQFGKEFAPGNAASVGESYPILPPVHLAPGQTFDEYSSTPPTSGPHWSQRDPDAPVACGIYDEGLFDEQVVHNLEHGHVIISHNLTNPEQIDELEAAAKNLPRDEQWLVVRPYSALEEGIVAITAWGWLQRFEGVDTEGLDEFYEAHLSNGPEFIPC